MSGGEERPAQVNMANDMPEELAALCLEVFENPLDAWQLPHYALGLWAFRAGYRWKWHERPKSWRR